MNFEELQKRKEELFAQQQEVAAQLAGLQRQENALAKAWRQEGIQKVAALIEQYQIPKYEIVGLYKDGEVKVARAPYGSKKQKEVNNPVLDQKDAIDQLVNQFFKLWAADNKGHMRLIAKEVEPELLSQVLTRLTPEMEAFLLAE